MKILIMGLPGSGKTTHARKVILRVQSEGKTVEWLNADEIRKKANDWDFSSPGRIRQAERLRALADESEADVVVCDFIAALEQQRQIFDADFTIWMDTIKKGRFEDTNQVFEPPTKYDMRICSHV